jgi:hypothetical protein
MSLHVNTLAIDAADPRGLATFRVAALDWHLIQPGLRAGPHRPGPGPFRFARSDGGSVSTQLGRQTTKNRRHFELVPDDQTAAVHRLEALGRPDIGPGDVNWVVMADPEGKELCVRRSYTGAYPASTDSSVRVVCTPRLARSS